jgi:hypothetical protein
MWTDTPSEFASAYVIDCGTIIKVYTGGVSDCKICVMSPSDNGASYYSVVEGVSEYSFSNVPASYVVTITKHNYLPKIIESSEAHDLSTPVISGPSSLMLGCVGHYSVDDENTQYATSWHWSSDVVTFSSPNSSSSNATGSTLGDGTIYLMVLSGCGRRFANVPVNVHNNQILLTFSPNPTSTETVISVDSGSEEFFNEESEWSYEIYSSYEKLVDKKEKQKGKKQTIDVSKWDKGIYIVKVTFKETTVTGKLLIE